jgi:hypothetical protein
MFVTLMLQKFFLGAGVGGGQLRVPLLLFQYSLGNVLYKKERKEGERTEKRWRG